MLKTRTSVLLLLTAQCIADVQAYMYSPTSRAEITGYRATHRTRRSPAILGKAALQIVLDGARFIYTNGLDKVFLKRGGFKTALKDFDAINANDKMTIAENRLVKNRIVHTPGEKIGKVGDRILILRKGDTTGLPTLSISQFPHYHDTTTAVINRIIVYTK